MEEPPATKLHSKGRLLVGSNGTADDDVVSFTGRGSVSLAKLVEPINPMLNYFEIEILNRGAECAIGIGVGALNYPQGRQPGWNKGGIGYHADDGHLYHEKGYGSNFGPTCTTGDVMGCGVDFESDVGVNYVKVFFTKNGRLVGSSQKMKRPVHGLYPLFGLHSEGEKVKYRGHWLRSSDNLQIPMELDSSPSSYWLRSNGIKFVDDGLLLEYAGEGGNVQDVGIAQANHQISPSNHYFELEIIDAGSIGAVAIGLAKTTYPLNRHPGWNPGAIGYHADDGKLFKEKGMGSMFGPTCSTGDTMGCGVRFSASSDYDEFVDDTESSSETSLPEELEYVEQYLSDNSDDDYDDYFGFGLGGGLGGLGGLGGGRGLGLRHPIGYAPPREKKKKEKDSKKTITVYFTKNGEEVGETECAVPSGGFYPVVAMLSRGEKIRVNLKPITG